MLNSSKKNRIVPTSKIGNGSERRFFQARAIPTRPSAWKPTGTVVAKQELLAEVWDQPYGGVEKTVDTHLSWLRAKLGESASAPRFLHTVRGVGIKLLAPPS